MPPHCPNDSIILFAGTTSKTTGPVPLGLMGGRGVRWEQTAKSISVYKTSTWDSDFGLQNSIACGGGRFLALNERLSGLLFNKYTHILYRMYMLQIAIDLWKVWGGVALLIIKRKETDQKKETATRELKGAWVLGMMSATYQWTKGKISVLSITLYISL